MPTPEQIDAIRRLNDAARSYPGQTSIANVTIGFQSPPMRIASPHWRRSRGSRNSMATMILMGSMISARSTGSRRVRGRRIDRRTS